MRGQGRVFRPKHNGVESLVWWIDYSIRGKRYKESTGTRSKKEAFVFLRDRIGSRTAGTLTGRPERVTLADLKQGLERHYLLSANASWPRALQAFAHLEKHFREDARAIDITKTAMARYQEQRLKDGAARNTVRYETGVLSAAYGVAVENDVLTAAPKFPQLAEGEKRSGFFGSADFAALVLELPSDIADAVRFARMTGWRRGEVTGLLWSQVDWDADVNHGSQIEPGPNACITITEEQTKGGDARLFPLRGAEELTELLLSRWRVRDGMNVFHRNGKPIGDFRKAWTRACKAAGIEGRLFHDLRRTAARDFRQAGVSEGEIMKLCGWKTRDMFDRYNILDAADLSRAVERRFNGKVTDRKPVTAGQAN